MLRSVTFAIALLILPATAVDASYCGQSSELAAARARWAAVRQSRVDPADAEKVCRAYGNHFYDAVVARQAASSCEDSVSRQSRDARRRDRRVQQPHRSPVHRFVTCFHLRAQGDPQDKSPALQAV